MSISHLVASYGYWAVFALVGMESLGIPLPGETALIIAGAYAGSTHGLSPWAVFAAAAAGAVIGDNIGFWIGGKGGYRLARRYGPKIRLDERKLKIARYLFDRYGARVVFFGRFTAVLRTYAAGGIVWAGVYAVASYEAGDAVRRVSVPVGVVLTVAGVLAMAAAAVVIHRQMDKLGPLAEAAYPGPLG
jgi:membrane protein DedA with SNARE-associated domain